MRLKDRVCAITGGGSGIGKAAAQLFAREGADVIVLELNEQTGRQTEAEILREGGSAVFMPVDVSDAAAVDDTFAQIDRRFGRLHGLYNNASVFWGKKDAPVTDLTIDAWHQILAINLNSVFYCSKFAIPLIIRSGGGAIVNTASSAGVIGIPGCDAYTASKGATVSMTRSMAVEYGPRKIRVNCIAPAAIYTPMIRESNLDNPSFDEQKFLNTTPIRRWGTPEDIANIALFLVSDEGSYVNGAIIVADGGITVT